MSQSTLPERVAVLESENAQCATDRGELSDKVDNLMNFYQQIRGMAKVVVFMWTVTTVGIGFLIATHH